MGPRAFEKNLKRFRACEHNQRRERNNDRDLRDRFRNQDSEKPVSEIQPPAETQPALPSISRPARLKRDHGQT